jgi:hypothetical protein
MLNSHLPRPDCLDRIDELDDIQRQVIADPESQRDVDHETQVSVIHVGPGEPQPEQARGTLYPARQG